MKRMKKKAKRLNQKGFSLVEVLMAVVILGLIAAPVCQMLMTSYQVNRRSKRLLLASDISQATLESLTALCWEDTSTLGGTAITGVANYYKNFPAGMNPIYPSNVTGTVPAVCGTLVDSKASDSGNGMTYYFNNVGYFEMVDDGEGGVVMQPKDAQNGEKPFQMEIEFVRSDYSKNLYDTSEAFYSVEVYIRIYDNDGAAVTSANRLSAPRLQVMNSAIVSKFRDNRT